MSGTGCAFKFQVEAFKKGLDRINRIGEENRNHR
jgi:hypothetical protein